MFSLNRANLYTREASFGIDEKLTRDDNFFPHRQTCKDFCLTTTFTANPDFGGAIPAFVTSKHDQCPSARWNDRFAWNEDSRAASIAKANACKHARAQSAASIGKLNAGGECSAIGLCSRQNCNHASRKFLSRKTLQSGNGALADANFGSPCLRYCSI